jgi:ferredoxin--NADP+ reductase
MFKIHEARFLAENIKLFRIEAPQIAQKRKAGQFVIIRVDDYGERIPLTIADSDAEVGTVTIIVQGVGKTTRQLNMLEAGDTVRDVVGPLGMPSHIENFGTAVSIGGGVGTAIALPTAMALKKAGNRVILEEEMKAVSDVAFITTDDGSYGYHGFVTDLLKKLIGDGEKVDFVLAIGPIPMMQAVAEVTRPHKIQTVVSLNPIMIDGTGMCGGCRVTVNGQTKFACVDGPEFDAHAVDFRNLTNRNRMYAVYEKRSMEQFIQKCRLPV